MDKLKEKLKKGLNLNKSSSGSSSIFSSKPTAFAGIGHKLGTAEVKAPPPPRTAPPSSSSGVSKPSSTNASSSSASLNPSPLPPPPPLPPFSSTPAAPHPSPPPPAPEQPPLIDFTPQADDSVLSAIDLLSNDPHCSTSAQILHRILGNIVANPLESKYRKVRLNNPKIQAAIVDTHGGVELILACGFVIVFESNTDAQQEIIHGDSGGDKEEKQQEEVEEGFAILQEDANLEPVQAAVALLQKKVPSLPPQNASSIPSAHQTPPPQPLPTSAATISTATIPNEREWAAPCDRKTQVILPASVDTDVPSWFFERTGQELKASFLAAVRKREQSQILMTKAMREKAAKNGGILPSSAQQQQVVYIPTVATVKVRLPEGISLQGEFSAGEPVAVLFAWVADCLCDPLQTFDLVLPDRRILEFNTKDASSNGTGARTSTGRIPSSTSAAAIYSKRLAERPSSIREAGLMPSVTVNLRWTGSSTVEMKGVPALRRELYTNAAA